MELKLLNDQCQPSATVATTATAMAAVTTAATAIAADPLL